jgi:DNA modification methylase
MNFILHCGDNRNILRLIPDNSIDSIVTDPPYEIAFMDKAWDNTGVAYETTLWAECLRVLKPGGHILAFGAPRTYHRLACAIEDAGFDIRDSLMWIYGSGFPKNHNISKALDKANGKKYDDRFALGRHIRSQREKLGVSRAEVDSWFGYRNGCQHWERQDFTGARIPNLRDYQILKERLQLSNDWDEFVQRIEAERQTAVDEHGNPIKKTGIDTSSARLGIPLQNGKKIQIDVTLHATDEAKSFDGWGTALKPAHEPIVLARKPMIYTVAENMTHHGVGGINIDACRVGDDVITNRNMSSLGVMHDDNWKSKLTQTTVVGRWPSNVLIDDYIADDLGTTARYYYVAKASKAEREAGLDGMELKIKHTQMRSANGTGEKNFDGGFTDSIRANHHPTVKPIELMRYLIRLVTPKGGTVLDPFMGSGSTGCASALEDVQFIGIEINQEYVDIAHQRIEHWQAHKKQLQSQQQLWDNNV